mgnify:CR=1 FL=1
MQPALHADVVSPTSANDKYVRNADTADTTTSANGDTMPGDTNDASPAKRRVLALCGCLAVGDNISIGNLASMPSDDIQQHLQHQHWHHPGHVSTGRDFRFIFGRNPYISNPDDDDDDDGDDDDGAESQAISEPPWKL